MTEILPVLGLLVQLLSAAWILWRLVTSKTRWDWLAFGLAVLLLAAYSAILLFPPNQSVVLTDTALTRPLLLLLASILLLVGLIYQAAVSSPEAQEDYQQTRRALTTLSACNQAIVRIRDEESLMEEICRIVVEQGGYRFAWLGVAEGSPDMMVRPIAQFGFEDDYLEDLEVTWSDTPNGQGPSGRALREGRVAIAQNIQSDPRYLPWREAAIERGYAASIALPVALTSEARGVLNIYAEESQAFDDTEVKLLQELADDLAFGLESIHAERARSRAEGRMEHLLYAAPDGIVVSDLSGQITLVNKALCRLFGYREEELLGKPIEMLIPGEQRQEHEEFRAEYYRSPTTRSMGHDLEVTGRHKDGTAIPIDVSLSYQEVAGDVLVTSIVRDVRDQREAIRALHQSETRFRLVTEASLAGIYIIEGNHFRYVNPAMATIFGYDQEELIEGVAVSQLVHPEDRSLVARNIQRRLAGDTDEIGYEFRGVRKDGEVIHCQVLGRRSDLNREAVIIGTLLDISARRRYEAKMERHIDQLSALRQIDLAITASLDPRLTFDVLLNQVTEHLGVDAADILTFDRHAETLNFAAGKGFHTEALQHTRLKLGEGYAGRAALERTTVHIQNLASDHGDLTQSPLLQEEGFVTYLAAPLVAKGRVQGVLEIFHRQPMTTEQEWFDFLEALAGQAAIAIDNASLFEELSRSNDDLRQAYDATLEGMARALELRDIETEGHSQRVTELAVRLATNLGVRGQNLINLRRGALLHDIGKMGIPDSILHKPGSLDEEEWDIMQRHPRYAYEMLAPIEHLHPALDIPYSHHEKWDGSGYPRGLEGEQIPFAARIFAIVDVWDALLSDRPYRDAWTEERVLEHIQSESGQHFDPTVVEAFIVLIEDL